MTRWRLLLEEYAPTAVHTAGEENLAADAFSRLPMLTKTQDKFVWEVPNEALKYSNNLKENVFFKMFGLADD